jgi:hypothetical protein
MDTRSTSNDKIMKASIRIMVHYDITGKDKSMYNGQIQEICELDFHSFKITLFHCNWVDAIKGVIKDKYDFISVDLNRQGYKSEPFMLAKLVASILCSRHNK